jgi:hypothetical protein
MRPYVTLVCFLLLTGASQGAERVEEKRDPARFTSDIVELHRAGWTLGNVEEGRNYTMVDPSRTRALSFYLGFDSDEDKVVSYRREPTAVPDERRVYPRETKFFEKLETGGPVVTLIIGSCGNALELERGSAFVDEYDYYVVERTVRGKDAGAAFTRELRAGFARGAHLTGLYREKDIVVFWLDDDVYVNHTIEAQVDADDQIVAVEVRRHGNHPGAGELRSESKLSRALARDAAVTRLAFTGTGKGESTKLVLTFAPAKGRKAATRHVIDLADMVYEEESGC